MFGTGILFLAAVAGASTATNAHVKKGASTMKKASKVGKKAHAQDITVKVHSAQGMTIVAACDVELLGKKLTDGELTLEVHRNFYEGVRVDEVGLIRHLSLGTCGNLVGKRTVKAAMNAGYVDRKGIMYIGGEPYAQFFRLGMEEEVE